MRFFKQLRRMIYGTDNFQIDIENIYYANYNSLQSTDDSIELPANCYAFKM